MAEVLPPSIPEFFTGKNIFLTGASGFIGKVMVEKLLRSCPNVGKLYVLLRPKKGKSPQERIKPITDIPLFDVLREQYPENLKKIVPINGDVNALDLGISPEDRKTLIEEINIVYHIAASVRFDDSLKDAVIMNTRGTREVVKLCEQMKHLDVFIHFSTTYAHTDKQTILEKLYPPHVDWKKCIELVESVDSHTLDVVTTKYIEPLPNTYTFTKGLAEHVINDMCDGKIPAIIIRPSIVISTMVDPFPGWIDNFNGPMGILLASGKGVMRSVYAKPDVIADYMPVDILVRIAMISTWEKGVEKDREEKYKLKIYNGSCNKIKYVSLGEIVHIGKKLCWDMPLNNILWYPDGSVTNCWYKNYLKILFYQLLPALFIDGLLVTLKMKPLLVKINRKIFIANTALHYFLMHEWDFKNTNSVALEEKLLPCDVPAFSYERDNEYADPHKFFSIGMMGARRYLLNEPDSTMPQAKLHSKRMWILAQIFNFCWYIVGIYVAYKLIVWYDVSSKLSNFYTSINTL